jgi:hypothetical protein
MIYIYIALSPIASHALYLSVSPRKSIAMASETHDTAQVAETSPDASTQPKSLEPEKTTTTTPLPPTTTTTVIVIISVLLSMFLVALDRTILATV